MAVAKLLTKPKVPLSVFREMAKDASSEQRRVLDAFSNAAARLGYGSSNLQEGAHYPLTRLSRNYILMVSLYRSNWIVRKVIDAKAEDMLKNGWMLTSQAPPKRLDDFNKVINDTGTSAKIIEAIKWSRLYGGSAALMILKGDKKLDKPLDVEDVDLDSYKGLLVFDRWSGIYPAAELNTDVEDTLNFGEPEYYEITTSTAQRMRVHSSRILKFTGRTLPLWERQAEQYWGISEVEVMYDELRKRDNTSWNIASLVFRANVFGLRQKDLAQMLSGLGSNNAQVTQRFWQMIEAQSALMSNQGMFVLPEEGGLETHQYGFSGISDVYQQFMLDICGATEYPMSRLFGRTVSGLGQQNEGDEHSYYDHISLLQQQQLDPQLKKLLPVIAMSTWGKVPDDFAWKYLPVRSLTDEDKADLAKSLTDSVVATFNDGIIGRKTALQELQQQADITGLFSNITDDQVEEAEEEPISMGEGGDEGSDFFGEGSGQKATDAAFIEAEHPRAPSGTSTGGQFVSKALGSASAPLKWKNPNGITSKVYRSAEGEWMYRSNANNEWFKAEKLPTAWHEKLVSEMTPKEAPEVKAEPAESASEQNTNEPPDEEIKIVSQEKKDLKGPELKKYLNEPANHKTVLTNYKNGYSTGSIAKALGLPQDKNSRAAIRALLRKAGLYKELNKITAQAATSSTGSEKIQSGLASLAEKYSSQFLPASAAFASSYHVKSVYDKYVAEAGVGVSKAETSMSKTLGHWTSNSHSKGAQVFKTIAAEYYGKDIEIEPKLTLPVTQLKHEAAMYKEGVMATKEFTQVWVKKYGAKTVYRGLSGAIAETIKQQIKSGATEIELTSNVLSSWSDSEAKAGYFGSGGVVLKMQVDPENVWACYGSVPFSSFSNFKSEREYVMGIPSKSFTVKKEDISFA